VMIVENKDPHNMFELEKEEWSRQSSGMDTSLQSEHNAREDKLEEKSPACVLCRNALNRAVSNIN
jgi:hypothetical protein